MISEFESLTVCFKSSCHNSLHNTALSFQNFAPKYETVVRTLRPTTVVFRFGYTNLTSWSTAQLICLTENICFYDNVIKWKHFPRYWLFLWGIPRLPVNSPHKGQWHGALVFSLICASVNKRLSKQSWGCWFESPPIGWAHTQNETCKSKANKPTCSFIKY